MSESKTYPDKKGVHLYQQQHVETVQRALDAAGDQMDSDDPPETERMAYIARSYLERSQFDNLSNDMRIQEARQVVASDHNMKPENVSLEALLKVTCSAYVGYQMTSDWKPENAESGGFKTEVHKNGDSA